MRDFKRIRIYRVCKRVIVRDHIGIILKEFHCSNELADFDRTLVYPGSPTEIQQAIDSF